ncbi:MAG: hypothetical protein LDL41_01190 [Coleofasciculus sp. S288]|nr:hypothetical protein [Coleofasciculus sp. S288]
MSKKRKQLKPTLKQLINFVSDLIGWTLVILLAVVGLVVLVRSPQIGLVLLAIAGIISPKTRIPEIYKFAAAAFGYFL